MNNGTLKAMTNCMIQSKNLEPTFLAEAVNCANYIQNKMAHKGVQNMTPMEYWTQERPHFSSFRLFGSHT